MYECIHAIYKCIHVCILECMHVCMPSTNACMRCMYECMHMMYVWMHTCDVCMNACIWCMFECIHVMYVCMNACMHVYTHACTYECMTPLCVWYYPQLRHDQVCPPRSNPLASSLLSSFHYNGVCVKYLVDTSRCGGVCAILQTNEASKVSNIYEHAGWPHHEYDHADCIKYVATSMLAASIVRSCWPYVYIPLPSRLATRDWWSLQDTLTPLSVTFKIVFWKWFRLLTK